MKTISIGRGAWLLVATSIIATAPMAAVSQGFPNVARTPGQLLSGPIAPEQGRSAIVAWHGERIVSVPEPPGSQPGADVLIRVVELTDPTNPQVTLVPAGAGGFNSHGYFQYGPYLFVGPHCLGDDLSPCNGSNNVYRDSFRIGGSGTAIGNSQLRRASMESDAGLLVGAYNRSGAQSPWGAEMWWTYGQVSGNAWLAVRRNPGDWVYDWNNNGVPTGPAIQSTWDHLGETGVIGMPFIIGNILIYASDQSGTGVATYDISDPSNPVLLDVLKEENPGGYWPEIYSHYIFFPRRDGGPSSQAGYMIVDFSDPADLRVVADRNVPGSNQYVTFQDEFAFMNNYKIDMRTFDVVLTLATNDTTLDASQFALPVGNLVVTGGYGSLGPGLAVWAHQAEPDTRPPFVAYHVPRPDQTNYSTVCPITLSIPETLKTETIVDGVSLILRPVGGSAVSTWHAFGQNKLLTVTPRVPLQTNTTYEMILTSGIQDAMGNGLEPYTFRFSTGGSLSGGNRPPELLPIVASPAVQSPGAPIDFSWTGSDPDGDDLEYRVDVGDGTPRSAWGTATSLQHTYTAAGHYQVTVQVRDEHGTVSAASRSVTVATTPSAPGSVSSTTVALSGGRVFAVNSDNDTVTAVDALTRAKLWEVSVAADPRNVAVAGDGTVWVSAHDGDAVDVLDPATGASLARIATGYGSAPIGIVAVPGSATILVSCTGDGTLRRFSTASRTQTASLSLGPTPRAIAVTHDGTRALVTRFISDEHVGQVYDVSLAGSMSLTRTIPLVRNKGLDGSASSRGVPNYLAGASISPDGQWAWVVGKKDNTNRGTFTGPGFVLGSDNTVRAQLMLINMSTNAEAVDRRLDIDNSESPVAVAFNALGDYAFIALQGNNQVAVVDVLDFVAQNNPGTVKTRWATGFAPQGLAFDATTNRLFANNFLGRSLTVFEAGPFLEGGSVAAASTTVSTVAQERLHPQVLLGKQIFYNAADPRMSAEGYMSCATCHVDGSHDGRTFDFTDRGEGFRNTTDLRGRSGMGHGLVHWSANFDEIQDFENDIRHGFGGTGFLSDSEFASLSATLGAPKAGASEELDALAAYVSSLGGSTIPRSPHRQPDGTLSATALAGQAFFNAHSCATCHTPATEYTDRTSHDVGTLRASSGSRLGGTLSAIDTPTLLGLHATAPYLHNGSAATLEEVFTEAGGTLVQAETGVFTGGGRAADVNWIPMKEWHGSQFAEFPSPGTAAYSISSTAAGTGAIEFRYNSGYHGSPITVSINGGTAVAMNLPQTPNEPGWMPNEWRTFRAPLTYAVGVNSIVITAGSGADTLKIDDILFSTPDDVQAASAHLRGFTAQERTEIVAYLRALDGQQSAPPALAVARTVPITEGAVDSVALASGSVVYTITNTGAGPLNLGSVFVTSQPPGAISLPGMPPAQVAPGQSVDLEIMVSAEGTGEIVFWNDAGGSNSFSWSLEATGAPSSIGDFFFVY